MINSILRYKKGNAISDGILYLILLLVFALLLVLGFKLGADLDADIQADPDLNANAKAVSSTIIDKYPKMFDAGFVFFVVLLWAAVIVASFNIDAHPIFMVFAIILMVFVLWLGAVFSNVYDEFTDDTDMQTSAASFPRINWIMDHLLHLILAVVASIIIVLYGKNKYGG